MRAEALPTSKQRQGAGDGGSSRSSVGRSAKVAAPPYCEMTRRP